MNVQRPLGSHSSKRVSRSRSGAGTLATVVLLVGLPGMSVSCSSSSARAKGTVPTVASVVAATSAVTTVPVTTVPVITETTPPVASLVDADAIAVFKEAVLNGDRAQATRVADPAVVDALEPWYPWPGASTYDWGDGTFNLQVDQGYFWFCLVSGGKVTSCEIVDEGESDPSSSEGDVQRNPGGSYGEYGVYDRVVFAPGTTGTTLSGGVAPGTVNGYLVDALAGQRLTLDLASPTGVFDLWAPDDSYLSGGTYSVVDSLPMDGDYLVVVQSDFGGASFDLTIEVTWPPVQSSASGGACPTLIEFVNYPMHLCHKGQKVKDLQQGLNARGYHLVVDGQFGPATQAALIDLTGIGVVNSEADYEAIWSGGGD